MKHRLIWCMLLICSLYIHGCVAPLLAPLITAGATGATGVAGVAGVASQEITKPKTMVDVEGDKSALETRSVQLREIDGEYKMTYRAAIDVLQDMGFSISGTNMETGHLAAVKKIPTTTTTKGFFSAQESKSFIPQEATVTMEPWGKGQTRVRVNTDLGKTEGSAMNLSETDKARYLQPEKFYEEFFANVSKAVFLRKEMDPNITTQPDQKKEDAKAPDQQQQPPVEKTKISKKVLKTKKLEKEKSGSEQTASPATPPATAP